MAQTLDGLTLPNYAVNGFQQNIQPNISKNYSLRGRLWIDFLNVRSGWILTYDVLTAAEYAGIRAKYDKQFTQSTFLEFVDPDLTVDAMVFLNMPDPRDINWNKSAVLGLVITLEPRDADTLI